MNWYQENRWIGNFLVAFVATLFFATWFLFHCKSEFAEAFVRFNEVATERIRLEHLNPFPNEENFRKSQIALDNYGEALGKTKEDLKSQVVPLVPLAPNEFQTRLRQAIVNAIERARTNGVKLPENFHLGFDEFTAALPDTVASPILGQSLIQVELLLNILIDNRVDAITNLRPTALSSKQPTATTPKSGAEPPKVVERFIVELAFTASPTAVRKILNQIASFDRQVFIVRTLHVRNEQSKGPSRERNGEIATAGIAPDRSSSPASIKFIVGEEHLEVAATVEVVRFTF